MRRRWLIFFIFSAQYLLLYLHRVCPAVLAPELVRDFLISGVSLGVLTSAYYYPYALMQLPIGMICDKWGARKTATIFGFVAAFGSIVFGLSSNFNVAVLSRIVLGFGFSAIFIPAMTVFGTWFKKEEYARVSGTFMAIGTIGWYLGTSPVAIASEIVGWRGIFVFIALITTIFALFTWFMVRDTPPRENNPNITKHPLPVSNEENRTIRRIFCEKSFCLMLLWFLFRVGILFGFFGLWAGLYLMDIQGCTKACAANILSMIPFAIIVGSPLLGYLSDRVFRSRKKILVGSAAALSLCWLIMLWCMEFLPVSILYVIFFVMGMACGAPASVGFSLVKELFPGNLAGTCIGIVNLAGFLGGAISQPFIGYLLDASGQVNGAYSMSSYRNVFQILFIFSIVVLASALFVKETLHEK